MVHHVQPVYHFSEGYAVLQKEWKEMIIKTCEEMANGDSVTVSDFGCSGDIAFEILKDEDGDYKILGSRSDAKQFSWDDWDDIKAVSEYINELYPEPGRFEVMLGPSSNQYWVYDNEKDAYIDPPKAVLDEARKIENSGKLTAEEYLKNLVEIEIPDWLYDKEYTYDDPEMEI